MKCPKVPRTLLQGRIGLLCDPRRMTLGDRPPSDCMKDSCTCFSPSSKPPWNAWMYLPRQTLAQSVVCADTWPQ